MGLPLPGAAESVGDGQHAAAGASFLSVPLRREEGVLRPHRASALPTGSAAPGQTASARPAVPFTPLVGPGPEGGGEKTTSSQARTGRRSRRRGHRGAMTARRPAVPGFLPEFSGWRGASQARGRMPCGRPCSSVIALGPEALVPQTSWRPGRVMHAGRGVLHQGEDRLPPVCAELVPAGTPARSPPWCAPST